MSTEIPASVTVEKVICEISAYLQKELTTMVGEAEYLRKLFDRSLQGSLKKFCGHVNRLCHIDSSRAGLFIIATIVQQQSVDSTGTVSVKRGLADSFLKVVPPKRSPNAPSQLADPAT